MRLPQSAGLGKLGLVVMGIAQAQRQRSNTRPAFNRHKNLSRRTGNVLLSLGWPPSPKTLNGQGI